MPLRRSASLLASAAALVALAPAASAWGSDATFALKPVAPTQKGYFVFDGRPGQTVHGAVRVLNVGTAAGSASLYPVDATTGQTSGAVYRSRQERRRDVGAWAKLATGAVNLAPGQSRIVPFSVKVPSGADAGQHLGGIVAQRSTGAAKPVRGGKKGTFKVHIQELSVLAVQVDVPGSTQAKMSLTGIGVGDQPGHQSLLLGIGNTGDVLVKGHGTLEVASGSGRVLKHSSFDLDTFVPGTHIDFPVYIQGKSLVPGRYRGTVSIAYRGRSQSRTFPFRITSAQAAQVFGSPAATQSPIDSSSPDSTLLYVLAAVSLLSLGAAFYFWRHRRPA